MDDEVDPQASGLPHNGTTTVSTHSTVRPECRADMRADGGMMAFGTTGGTECEQKV